MNNTAEATRNNADNAQDARQLFLLPATNSTALTAPINAGFASGESGAKVKLAIHNDIVVNTELPGSVFPFHLGVTSNAKRKSKSRFQLEPTVFYKKDRYIRLVYKGDWNTNPLGFAFINDSKNVPICKRIHLQKKSMHELMHTLLAKESTPLPE